MLDPKLLLLFSVFFCFVFLKNTIVPTLRIFDERTGYKPMERSLTVYIIVVAIILGGKEGYANRIRMHFRWSEDLRGLVGQRGTGKELARLEQQGPGSIFLNFTSL